MNSVAQERATITHDNVETRTRQKRNLRNLPHRMNHRKSQVQMSSGEISEFNIHSEEERKGRKGGKAGKRAESYILGRAP